MAALAVAAHLTRQRKRKARADDDAVSRRDWGLGAAPADASAAAPLPSLLAPRRLRAAGFALGRRPSPRGEAKGERRRTRRGARGEASRAAAGGDGAAGEARESAAVDPYHGRRRRRTAPPLPSPPLPTPLHSSAPHPTAPLPASLPSAPLSTPPLPSHPTIPSHPSPPLPTPLLPTPPLPSPLPPTPPHEAPAAPHAEARPSPSARPPPPPLADPPPPRTPRVKFVYGNYEAYYGYRYTRAADGSPRGPEPRVRALREELFRGKDCLDVGCNAGRLTLDVAERYGCRSMLGVDIDAKLIAKARALLRTPHAPAAPRNNAEFKAMLLRPTVRFVHCNFVQQPRCAALPPPASLDTVLCLSTSKWVHLNFGDAGVRCLFRRAYDCLRPGGHFVLEPQPWSSYRKRANLTPCIALHYKQIQLRPHQFVECLLGEIGFRTVEELEVPYAEEDSAGFKRRPLLVLTK